jgi:hypothetical protein
MVTLKCEGCGKEFSVKNSRAQRGQRFCGRTCADSRPREAAHLTCHQCGRDFTVGFYYARRSPRHFCSKACYQNWRKEVHLLAGDTHPFWRGGPDLERRQWNGTPEGKRWRQAVKEAAGWKCEACPATTDLQSHHVKGFRDFPELRADVTNGRCLCRSCHMKAERGTLADRHTSGPYGTYIGKYAVIDSREEKG